VQQAVSLNTSGNAVVTLPFLNGGMTKGAAVGSSGGVIVRRITVNNPSGSVASANVSITTSNDGNVSNAVVANVTLSSVSGVGTFQDLTVASPFTGNVVSGLNTNSLYVNVNTPSGNSNTVTIAVYGDVVTF
jgi:hypothetical protein